jgi:transposase
MKNATWPSGSQSRAVGASPARSDHPHHRFLIGLHLTQVEALEAAVVQVEGHSGDALGPFQSAVTLLMTMPGLGETAARVLVAEIGVDMTRFPSAGHLVSWAGRLPLPALRARQTE